MAACFLLLTAAATATTVTGRVTLSSGKAARRAPLDASGVVVWLEPSESTSAPAPHRVKMIQKNKTFLPHVLAISVGSTVDFPNYDPIFHNAFSSFDGQVFDIGLYPPGQNRSIIFRRPGVVRVFCNIHAEMSAVIVVVNASHFGTSSRAGSVELRDVPPGDYRMRVFHERATTETLDALSRVVHVEGESIELPPIAISESGYLPMPHKNKFGKDYPPPGASNGYSIP